MNKRYISYDEYGKLVSKLIAVLEFSQSPTSLNPEGLKPFDFVYGIPRGGLPLAVELSHKMGIKFGGSDYRFDLNHIENYHKNILLVDDLVDSGQTMTDAIKNIFRGFVNIKTACLFFKPWAIYKPDYFVEQTIDWITFPYEDMEEVIPQKYLNR